MTFCTVLIQKAQVIMDTVFVTAKLELSLDC